MTSPEPPTSGSTADAAAVWNSQKATYTAANSFGKILQDIESDISTTDGKVDTVDTVVDGLATDNDNSWLSKTFWSEVQANATITGGSTDVALPSVIIPNETDIATFKKVICIMKYRKLDNSDAAGNAINGGADVQVKASAQAWGVGIDAIDIIDNSMQCDAAAESGGDVVVGDIDVKATVLAVNDTYNFQFDDIQADANNLVLSDVQMGIIIYYTV